MAVTKARYRSQDNFANVPRNNPCAQCGAPIPFPDWVESGEGRSAYLWCCRTCDYQFEAVAVFPEAKAGEHPLAA